MSSLSRKKKAANRKLAVGVISFLWGQVLNRPPRRIDFALLALNTLELRANLMWAEFSSKSFDPKFDLALSSVVTVAHEKLRGVSCRSPTLKRRFIGFPLK